jgi:Flp pilus assembly pilin Flp
MWTRGILAGDLFEDFPASRIACIFAEKAHDCFHFLQFRIKEGKAMNTSPSPVRFLGNSSQNTAQQNTNKAAEYESTAQLVEGFVPRFKNKRDKRFYREVVDAYRTAARDILRRAWSDEKGQDIAEYAVVLAVILVLVVGTIRLVGSNANTAFSQAASSIQ